MASEVRSTIDEQHGNVNEKWLGSRCWICIMRRSGMTLFIGEVDLFWRRDDSIHAWRQLAAIIYSILGVARIYTSSAADSLPISSFSSLVLSRFLAAIPPSFLYPLICPHIHAMIPLSVTALASLGASASFAAAHQSMHCQRSHFAVKPY